MIRMILTLGLLLGLLLGMNLAHADVLVIEQVRQAGNMNVPENGQTQAEVESRFAAPISKGNPVGDPPITRWVYDRWSVYFEYDRVLFTVLHKGEVIENATPDS